MKMLFMILAQLVCLNQEYVRAKAYGSFVRVHKSGFSPFDDVDPLPYSILQNIYSLQQQQRAGRQLQTANQKQQPISTILRATIRNTSKRTSQRQSKLVPTTTPHAQQPRQSVHFERSPTNPQQYLLYDNDGELLMNFNYHKTNDASGNLNMKLGKNFHTNDLTESRSGSDSDSRYNKLGKLSNSDATNRQIKHIWIQL